MSCRCHPASIAGAFVQDGAVHNLEERPITFDYEYKMSCPDCPGITTLTSAEYYSEPNGAHVQCARCRGDIHFGPAVMALRDAGDPVLDDQRACRFAWYHTSTDPSWPSGAHPMPPPVTASPRRHDAAGGCPPHPPRLRDPGSASRNVRNRDRVDAAPDARPGRWRRAVLPLPRCPAPPGVVIEPGWRDENLEEAAQITQSALGRLTPSGISTSTSLPDRSRWPSGGRP